MTDKKIRGLIFETVIGAVIQGVTAAVPFFRLPVIHTLFKFVVMKVATLIYEELARYAVFSLIDLKVAHEKDAYLAAVVKLKTVDPKNSEEAQRAEEDFKRTLAALIRLKP